MKTFYHTSTSFLFLQMFHDVRPVWCRNSRISAGPGRTLKYTNLEVDGSGISPHLKEPFAIQLCSCPPKKKIFQQHPLLMPEATLEGV